MQTLGSLALLATALGGCGDDLPAPAGPCWPIEDATPAGTVELGTGDPFEAMPDSLRFVRGNQGGTFLVLTSRMTGLRPGNPMRYNDPGNPRTRFSAVLADGTIVGRPCPITLGYEENGDMFDAPSTYRLEFLPLALGVGAFDTTITLSVEVIDSEKRYARDEKRVLVLPPEDWADAGPTGPSPDAMPAAGVAEGAR